MSGTRFELIIVSAEASIFSGSIKMMKVMGSMGELGIHPGHSPLLTQLKAGQVIAIRDTGQEDIFYVSSGLLEVQPTVVTILADTALRGADLDEAAAFAAKEQAERILSKQRSGLEYSKAMAELAEATAQLRAIQMLRKQTQR